MKNQHIDAVVKYFYPVAAGIETNMLETYSELVKRGWDVTVHTSTDTLTEKNVLSKTETVKGIKVKRYKNKLFGFWPEIDWKNTNIIALHNFNIFPHFQIMVNSLYLKLINKKTYGLVVTPHGGFTPDWSTISPSFIRIFKKIYQNFLGVFLLNRAVDINRSVSDWERIETISKDVKSEKVITITNGIENEAYLDVDKLASKDIKAKLKNFGKYLIQIGRVYQIKNYETTIKTLPYIPSDINFVIAGPIQNNDSYLKYLKGLAKKLGVENRVHFIGVVRGVDKYYLIKHAQMMVHMAKWESFCNVVHEGLSQGLVCIVANNTALPLLIKNGVNGFCVDTYDFATLAEKINFVLNNDNSKSIIEMKERNRKYGLEESWASVAEKVDRLFKSLI